MLNPLPQQSGPVTLPESGTAITLLQPWATLTVLGLRWLETRPWSTNYRGRLLIHASSSDNGLMWAESQCPALMEFLRQKGVDVSNMPRKALLGEVNLDEILPLSTVSLEDPIPFGWLCDGDSVWKFSNAKQYDAPVRARGYPSLWSWKAPRDQSSFAPATAA